LQDILTCWGDGKINVNTASADVLKCIPDLKGGAVDAIVGYRAGPDGELGTDDDKDFADMRQIGEVLGIAGESLIPIQQYCKVDSYYYTIKGIATRRQGKVAATCVATILMEEGNTYVIKWREEFLDS
jgi:type II secretory pathway component PulK